MKTLTYSVEPPFDMSRLMIFNVPYHCNLSNFRVEYDATNRVDTYAMLVDMSRRETLKDGSTRFIKHTYEFNEAEAVVSTYVGNIEAEVGNKLFLMIRDGLPSVQSATVQFDMTKIMAKVKK